MKQKWTLIGFSIVALGLYLLTNLDSVGLRGSVQTNLLENKDAVADILPPPLYAIEGVLLINQFLHSNDQNLRRSLSVAIKQEYEGFKERERFWVATELYKNSLYQKEIEAVFLSGQAVFEKFLNWESKYLEIHSEYGDRNAEEKLIASQFQDHRAAVASLVKLLRNQQVELIKKSDGEIIKYKFVIMLLVLFLCLLVFLLRSKNEGQIVELSREQLWLPLIVAVVSYWFYGQIGEKLSVNHGRGPARYFDLIFVGLVTVLVVRIMRVRYLHLANQVLSSEQKYRSLLQTYTHDIMVRIEEEKKRISREVHDGIVQLLGSIKFRLEGLKQKIESRKPVEANELERPIELLQSSITDLRQLCHELRPSLLDNVGLIMAMQSLIDDFENRTSVVLIPDFDFDDQKLNEQIRSDLFRIFQELLSNCEKHAQATEATINIVTKGNTLSMIYTDNGRGVDLKKRRAKTEAGLGLVNISERVKALGGKVELSTSPGEGFQVRIEIPIESSLIETKGESTLKE